MNRLLVHKIGVVGSHPHVVQRYHQTPLIRLAEKLISSPLRDKSNHYIVILVMDDLLLFRKRYKKVLVYPFRELLQDFILLSPDHDVLEGIPDRLKVFI